MSEDSVETKMLRRTRIALALSGWRPGRAVTCTAFQGSLVEMGYVVVPAATAVLREFCGVGIGFESRRWKQLLNLWVSANQFWIGALESDDFFDMIVDQFRDPLPRLPMDEYRLRIGCDLTPIGGIARQCWYIAVGANQALYAVGGKHAWLIGRSTTEALNRLVYNRDPLQKID